MPPVVTVVADDLSGACEIAGRAWVHGLTSVVSLGHYPKDAGSDLVVIDSDSRLVPAGQAEAKVETIASRIPLEAKPYLFKKTDSVLRGSVHAEVAAMMRAAKKRSALLVPANPDLGRGISSGVYTIKGVPLSETEFADDPHHPARDSRVLQLLRGSRLPVRSAPAGARLSDDNGELVVGDALTHADLEDWAQAVTPDILPGGSSAFFKALLDRWFPQSAQTEETGLPQTGLPQPGLSLLVSGTRAPAQRDLLNRIFQTGGPAVPLDPDNLDSQSLRAAARQVDEHFQASGKALVFMRGGCARSNGDLAQKILSALSELTATLLSHHPVAHLAVEGGATAASIFKRMEFLRLSVLREWSPGTVLVKPLQSDAAPGITVKPGSYPWPEVILDSFFQSSS